MMRMMRVMMMGAVVAGLAGVAWGQATAPATQAVEAGGAATQQNAGGVVVASLPAPKQAVAKLLMAINKGDEAGLRGTLVMPEDAGSGQTAAAETLLKLLVGTSKLQAVAEQKYGPDGVKAFGVASTAQMESRLKGVEVGTLAVAASGDAATLTIPADPDKRYAGGTLVLKKVGGEWKVDAASLFHLEGVKETEEFKQRMALAGKLVELTGETSREIAAGKYATAGEAYQAFMTRSVAATKEGEKR